MEQAAQFEVEGFEHVRAGGERTLLRVAGRWQAPEAAQLGAAQLEIRANGETHHFATLPAPDATPPEAGPDATAWRGAFLAPAALVAVAGAEFALRAGDAAAAAVLPQPALRRLGEHAEAPAADPGTSSLEALRDECRRRIAAERVAASRQSALEKIGQRLAASNTARREAEARIVGLEQDADALRGRLREREAELAAIVARMTDAEQEGDTAQAARAEIERALSQSEVRRVELESQLEQARARVTAAAAAARTEAERALEEQARVYREDSERSKRTAERALADRRRLEIELGERHGPRERPAERKHAERKPAAPAPAVAAATTVGSAQFSGLAALAGLAGGTVGAILLLTQLF